LIVRRLATGARRVNEQHQFGLMQIIFHGRAIVVRAHFDSPEGARPSRRVCGYPPAVPDALSGMADLLRSGELRHRPGVKHRLDGLDGARREAPVRRGDFMSKDASPMAQQQLALPVIGEQAQVSVRRVDTGRGVRIHKTVAERSEAIA
jgi:hypothetical protein